MKVQPQIYEPRILRSYAGVFEGGTGARRRLSMASYLTVALAIGTLAAGTALRIGMFLSPRSFGRDEAAIALNLVDRSLLQLFSRLDHDHYAPIGFLLSTKLVGLLAGYTEQTLRFVPLVAGLTFPVLMWLFARRVCSAAGTIAVTALAALAVPLVTCSSQLRPSSTDALVTVLFLLLYGVHEGFRTDQLHLPTLKSELLKGLCAAVLVLFSFPAVFTLVAVLAIRLGFALYDRQSRALVRLIAGALPWAATFAVYFAVSLRGSSTDGYLQEFWAHAFLTIRPSLWSVRFDVDLLTSALGQGLGLDQALALLIFAIGLLKGFLDHRPIALTLGGIVLLTTAASVLHRWPFDMRLVLFMAPVTLMAAGWAVDAISEERRPAVAVVALVALLFGPVVAARDLAGSFSTSKGMRVVAAALDARFRDGDVVYAYYLLDFERTWYRRQGVFPAVPVVESTSLIQRPLEDAERQIASLPPDARVWFLVGNSRMAPLNEREAILDRLSKQRPRLDRVSDQLYLFGPVQR